MRHRSHRHPHKNPTGAVELHCGQRMRDGIVKGPCYAVTNTQGSGVAVRRLGDQRSHWKVHSRTKGVGLGGQRDGLPPALEPLSMGAGQLSGSIVRPDHQETITDRFRAVDLQWMWVGDSPTATQPTEGRTKLDRWTRSMRAGGSPPATLDASYADPTRRWCPFNEGRGFTPGDTSVSEQGWSGVGERSMRAGGSPPATPGA